MRFSTSLAVCLSLTLAGAAGAEPERVSAPAIAEALAAGEVILLDIRTPGEWAETGVAAGAWPVSMHAPGFADRLAAIRAAHPDTPVAVICATGGRSGYMADLLEREGVAVMDLAEGMLGNASAPGWIARGLAVVSPATAEMELKDALD